MKYVRGEKSKNTKKAEDDYSIIKVGDERVLMPQMVARDSWDVKSEELKNKRDELGIVPMYVASQTPIIAKALCERYGMSDEQLAYVFGVTKAVFIGWKREYVELFNAIQFGRDLFDGDVVEEALLKTALGYKYVETKKEEIELIKKEVVVTSEGKKKTIQIAVPGVKTTVTEKEVSPDVKAIMFYLTNRKKERWKNEKSITTKGVVDHNHSGTVTHADISNLNKDQLLELRSFISKHKQGQGEIVEVAPSCPINVEDILSQLSLG